MNNIEQTNIKLVVDDEQALYTTYSPEPEFNDQVRWYISTKAATVEKGEDISLTVISQKPLEEEGHTDDRLSGTVQPEEGLYFR